MAADVGIDEGEEHNSGLLLDFTQRAVELRGRPDQGVDMGDRPEVGILCCSRLGHGVQRFSRGVRHEMKVEITLCSSL